MQSRNAGSTETMQSLNDLFHNDITGTPCHKASQRTPCLWSFSG